MIHAAPDYALRNTVVFASRFAYTMHAGMHAILALYGFRPISFIKDGECFFPTARPCFLFISVDYFLLLRIMVVAFGQVLHVLFFVLIIELIIDGQKPRSRNSWKYNGFVGSRND